MGTELAILKLDIADRTAVVINLFRLILSKKFEL